MNVQKRFTFVNRKNIATYGTGAVVSTALMSSNANAAFDISAALAANDAKANIETAGLWVLGVVVLIYCTKKVIGFFGR